MEVKMQTSFIPKKPIIESRSKGSGISLFLLLSILIFIVAVALVGGIFLWRKSLISQIEKDKAALVAAKESYEEDTINPLIRLNDRIEESKGLLSRHLAVSPVFLMLEKNILRNVRIKNMKFSYAGSDKIKVELSGTAASYDALSKQSDAFGSETLRKFISQPVISDFSPTPDGSVSFNFNALVDSRLVSYKNTIENIE
jgi:nitrate reductase NapE component